MALIRRLDSNDDWCFGRGTSDYASNEDCVIQNLRTRLKEWKYNCFFARLNGIDWITRLGDKNQKELLDEDTKKCLISYNENSFGFDGLTSNYKEAFEIFGQEVVYDKVNLEDILMYYTRG